MYIKNGLFNWDRPYGKILIQMTFKKVLLTKYNMRVQYLDCH